MKQLLFSTLENKLEDQTKRSSIRKHVKPRFEIGDFVELIFADKGRWTRRENRKSMGVVIITNRFQLSIVKGLAAGAGSIGYDVLKEGNFCDEDAIAVRDGFDNAWHMLEWLDKKYDLMGNKTLFYDYEWHYLEGMTKKGFSLSYLLQFSKVFINKLVSLK